MSQIFLFVRKVAGRAFAEGRNSSLTQDLRFLTWDQAEILEIDFKL